MFRGFKAPEEHWSINWLARLESEWRSGSLDHTSIDLTGSDWGQLPSSEAAAAIAAACCFGGAAREVAC